MECPVCYGDKASCNLVCGHSFCKDCVKTWYYKCDEPSCPMCRRNLYFKGMHKVVDEWDRERAFKKNEDAFNQAFDDIFEEIESESEFDPDSESDTDSDSESWETDSGSGSEPERNPVSREHDLWSINSEKDYYSEYMLGEIVHLQKAYQKAEELGIDFEWYYQNEWLLEIEPSKTIIIEDDVFPHFKNLFISNHKNSVKKKRVGKRVPTKTDSGFTAVFVVVF
jgi:hypothetical protein